MLERYPQGRATTWLARAIGRVMPKRMSPAALATKSLEGPYFALDRLGSPAWAPRDYAAFAREGFMQNAILYRSVRMIAEAAASVPLLLYSGDEEITEHPLLSLLARPNAASTAPDLLEALYGFLLVSGNAYLEALPLGQDIRELHTLRPDRMKVVPGADGWPEAYEYTVDGRTRRLAGEAAPGVRSVLHLKLFHPLNDHYGLSPIEAAASAVDIHNTASRWNKALLDNSARPSGALVYTARDGNLTVEQYDRLKAELEQGFQGAARAGRPLLLEGGLDWKSMSLSPKDMDFIEAKHVAAREIALALGVPPMLLGIPGDNTYSNYQEATRTFWRSTVLPLVTRTAKSLSCWLAPAYAGVRPSGSDTIAPPGLADCTQLELRPDIDSIEALSTEREALWTRVDKATFLTQNEKRAAVGYGPLDGGDEIKASDADGLPPFKGLAPKANFNPGQLRIPAGQPGGGQWIDGDGGNSGNSLVHPARVRLPGGPRNPVGQRNRETAARAREAIRQVRRLDPSWEPPATGHPPDSPEHEQAVAEAAERRLSVLEMDDYRSRHRMPVLNGRPARRWDEGTVAITRIDGSTEHGVNSGSPGYTDEDRAEAMRLRDILVAKYPDTMSTDVWPENVGQFPNDALFHAEATLLLRLAERNGGNLNGRTVIIHVDRRVCDNCQDVLPLLTPELGNPTVRLIDALGRRITIRNGRWSEE